MVRLILLGMLLLATAVCYGLSVLFAGRRRGRAGLLFVILTGAACLLTLWIDVVPGRLGSAFMGAFLLSLLASPLVLIVGVVVLIVVLKKSPWKGRCRLRHRRMGFTWQKLALWFLVLLCTYLLVRYDVPHRAGFAVSRSSFEALVQDAPVREHGERAEDLGRLVGVYLVDRYAADPRGGVFFRVHSGGTGIGPGTRSYGFVYQPNFEGTPFGRVGYRTTMIGQDWYCFSVSDD